MSATSSPSNPHFSVVTAPGTPGLLVRTPVLRPSDGAADEARNTGGGHPHRSQQEGIENEQVSKIPPATANKSRTSNDFVIFETSTGKKVNIRGSDKMCRFLTGIPEASRTRADPAIKFPLRVSQQEKIGNGRGGLDSILYLPAAGAAAFSSAAAVDNNHMPQQ